MIDLSKWNTVKGKVRERLSSSEWQNLEKIVKVGVAADIWRTWYIDLSAMMADAIAPITYDMLHSLGVSLDDLKAAACTNRKDYTVQNMGEIFGFGDTRDIPMYVISNDDCCYGAIGILDDKVQQRLYKLFPDGAYILPSSIHEVIAVPSNVSNPKDLAYMVREINRSQVAEKDRLSDHVFQMKDGCLCVAA